MTWQENARPPELAGTRGRALQTTGEAHDPANRFYNASGKRVGTLVHDERGLWLEKHVRTGVHQLRVPRPAWAADATHLAKLQALGAAGIRLIDEDGRVWSATLTRFWQHGKLIDRGHGEQLALALSHWQRDGQPQQPSLFGSDPEAA
jgi:hypothetical protein